jgi:hypothetical protein
MWGCEFKKLLRENPGLENELSSHRCVKNPPLIFGMPCMGVEPKQSTRGTEPSAAKRSTIYMDVTSLYPYLCKYGKFTMARLRVYCVQTAIRCLKRKQQHPSSGHRGTIRVSYPELFLTLWTRLPVALWQKWKAVRAGEPKYVNFPTVIVQIVFVIVTAVQVNSQQLCPSVCECDSKLVTCTDLFSGVTDITQHRIHAALSVLRVHGTTNLELEEDRFLRWKSHHWHIWICHRTI